jgi:hypothetical protein
MARTAAQLIGVSVRECARQLGISDTAILKAIKAGRCTRHADGSVDVEAVRQGMNVTADPLRGGQRQAGVFGAVPVAPVVAAAAPSAAQQVEMPPAAGEPPQARQAGPAHAPLLAARTLTEQTRAAREQIELAKLQGLVAELEPMTRAVHDAMVAARSELLALPDRLTPLVTPETDTGKVHAMIEAEVIRVCETLRDKLQRHATQPATATA